LDDTCEGATFERWSKSIIAANLTPVWRAYFGIRDRQNQLQDRSTAFGAIRAPNFAQADN
jgi:hypothetical protein